MVATIPYTFMSHQPPKKTNILGTGVSVVNLHTACEAIGAWIVARAKVYVCVAPVSTLVDCRRNPDYRRVVEEAAMVTPDGMPVVWLGRRQGNPEMQRTYGPDLMKALCAHGQAKGTRHYFYGGTPEVCEKLRMRLQNEFPKLNIVGTYSPEFKPQATLEDRQVIARINQARPDILWVALGSPKQDFWMAKHRALLDVPVMIGIGAAFDFLSGSKPHAPQWIQRSGLEWLFRLCCEPKRLWKRYLLGNSLFIYYLIADVFHPRKSHA